jgi:uncharacterized protein YigE (DUF2233 family)
MRYPLILLALFLSLTSVLAWDIAVVESREHPSGVHYLHLRAKQGTTDVNMHAVAFTEKTHTISVLDHPPETPASLASEMQRTGSVAGVNASYFHPDMRPLGLVVANGKTIHQQQKARLLSGIFAATKDKLFLLRASEFKLGPKTREAVQAGPFLVDKGTPVQGLDTKRVARRTAVATDGKGKWILLATSPLSLAELGSLLASPDLFPELGISRALNLDGGSSTAFWFDSKPKPVSISEFGAVRNHIAVRPR